MASRYNITTEDLKRAALNLQIGAGIADRLSGTDATSFIEEAEDWADSQVSEFIGVPLKPTPALGQDVTTFSINTVTSRNYPREFVDALKYRALGLLLNSEYFENSPNKSEAAVFALELAVQTIEKFMSRRTTNVGSGRIRHSNPHMPPNIAPKMEVEN